MSSRLGLWLIAAVGMVGPWSPANAAPDDFTWDPQVPPETVGTWRHPEERIRSERWLQEQLAALQVREARAQPIELPTTVADRALIDDLARPGRVYLIGLAKRLGIAVDLAPAFGAGKEAVAMPLGAARGDGEGGLVWTAALRSRGATAMRLHLTAVDLPDGAGLFVYNLQGQAFGPYVGRGPLGDGVVHTHTVFGEQILLQLHLPPGAERTARLRVSAVGVLGERFLAPRYAQRADLGRRPAGQATEASHHCAYNADCVVNASCSSSDALDAAREAVASIVFQSGSGYFLCSGGLVADSDAETVIPYFLTAHHCVGTEAEAASVETWFDYAASCDDPDCTRPYGTAGETVGATLVATHARGDFALLRLSEPPVTPNGVVTYLGWSTTAVARSGGASLQRVSHPSGAPQAHSEHVVDTRRATCRGLSRGTYIYSTDVRGATEGGSSGAPSVNEAGQIVGQLYGGCGYDVEDVCDAAANATVDGAFASYFAAVSPFLAAEARVACAARNASCSTHEECCSKACRGRPGKKTCR